MTVATSNQAPIQPPQINREQAQQQLELLGHQPGDKVYLTAFFPKGDSRTKGENRDKGRKSDRLNYAEVEAWQAEGRGVYFVVNGHGHGKKEVKNCRAVFYEHDNLDKEIQRALWQSLGLPEPTVQVDTSGKSIHSYWVFKEPIHPKLWAFQETSGKWTGLQADLLRFANADTSLVNPNRVMRLAGGWYMQWDEEQNQTVAVAPSKIVGGCGKRYSYTELRKIIPRQQSQPELRRRNNQQQDTTNDLLDFRCVGYQLPHWNAHGRKGWATFQCPVHTSDGKKHSPDQIHVNLSNGAWEAHCGCDRKLIYQTICEMVGHSPKPSGRGYSSGGMGNGNGGNRRGSFSGDGSSGDGGDGGDGEQPLVELSLRDRVLEILNRNQERSHRDEAFIKLAQTTGATTREIKELAASVESEVDLGESRSERKTEIENLLRVGKYQLELQDYLAPAVAQPLKRVAGWMGTTPAAMLTTLYPVIGSLLKVGTRLELIKATDFYALPVVYTGLVCESGGGKSPAQKTIINPLFRLQDEAEIEYKERLSEYQQELSEWKKLKDTDEPAPEQPVPREYYTTDATSEAIALIQSNQPKEGFLGWFDELPALFKSQGQYKNGRGADGEKILSGRDGTGFKVNRASGKRLVVNQSAYSITGSLQPVILRQMMGDFTDANGQWARFLWTVMQVQPAPYPDDAIPFDVSGLLKGIYKRLRNLPPITYTLSSQAKALYRNWYNELDRLKMAESRQGLRAIYSKMKGDTGVLALLLHCFNGCVVEGLNPALEVDEATMAAAIKLSKYHIGQVKLIHSEGDVANGDVAAIHAKIIQLSERKGWLKAADVRDIDRQTKKQFSADDIRRHFQELEASGFGQTRGQRTKLMWSICKDTPPDGNPLHSDETQDSFEQLRTNSGQKSPNSGQTQDSLKMAESITNISVQQLVIQTQDTQDSFLASAAPSPNPLSPKNELKAADLNFDDLSCPEFEDKAQTQITVGISEDTKTQDSCPESVLSCPEFGANSDEDTLSEKVAQPEVDETQPNASLPIYQRSNSGFEVLQNQTSLVLNIQCDKSDSEDDEMLPDYIKSIADVLANEELCPNKEVLAELRTCGSDEAINAAYQSLPIERRSQIEQWLSELDA